MLFEEILQEDIKLLNELQPEGWPDLSIEFQHYLNQDFAYPVKIIINNDIVGVGCSIVFEKTGWLAHIIVKTEYRNKGIGYEIVKYLVDDLKTKGVETYLLIATELGEPVYKKVGFKTVSNYLDFRREKGNNSTFGKSKNIFSYNQNYFTEVISLDSLITGEKRELLLAPALKNAVVYKINERIDGVYLPDLGEGLIIANTNVAGVELMKLKYSNVDKAVIPEENQAGIDFLLEAGFKLHGIKAKRMILGKDILWKADCYYSRIGGNFG